MIYTINIIKDSIPTLTESNSLWGNSHTDKGTNAAVISATKGKYTILSTAFNSSIRSAQQSGKAS